MATARLHDLYDAGHAQQAFTSGFVTMAMLINRGCNVHALSVGLQLVTCLAPHACNGLLALSQSTCAVLPELIQLVLI